MPTKDPKNNDVVFVRNLHKSYGSKPPVIAGLCMTVKKGTIYGLLGPSGCGKTTLISCIVGLRKCDSGDLFVFGNKPGSNACSISQRFGYMPQDLALYSQLSILETLQFYGRTYGMTNNEILERYECLNELLNLPTKFKIIRELSGGEQRRVSLAVALTHSPELLILDEPTVGLDPLLRISIWEHMKTLVSTVGTTILLSTHYIEETRLSNTIGVLRRGRLLVEDTPQNLMKVYQCELLEKVFLQLCREDEKILKENQQNTNVCSTRNITFPEIQTHTSEYVVNESYLKLKKSNREIFDDMLLQNFKLHKTLRRIYALTSVLLLTLMRYPTFLFALLFMPSIQGSITLWTFGSKPLQLNFGIINHELANWTAECESPKYLQNACDLSALSCKYINQLGRDHLFRLKSCDNETEAIDQVQLGNLWGYLVFPNNYSKHTVNRFVSRHFAQNDSIEGSLVHVHLDYSESLSAFLMIRSLNLLYVEHIKQLAISCQMDAHEAEIPLHYRPQVYGSNDDDFKTYIMPGIIICSILMIVYSLTSAIIITDLKQGTFSRGKAAGLQCFDVIASHLITQGIVTLCQILIWNVVLHFLFDLTIVGSIWLWLIFCLLAGLCGAALGLFVGMICKDEVEGLVVGVFLFSLFILLGGAIFPLEYMSRFWQQTGSFLPTSLPTRSLRSVVVRGLGLTHPLVWPGLVASIAWTLGLCVCCVIAYMRLRG